MKFFRPLFLYASMFVVAAFTVPLGTVFDVVAHQLPVSMIAPEPMAYVSDAQRIVLTVLFVLAAVATVIALALYLRTTKTMPLHERMTAWRLPVPDRSPPG